MPRTPRLVAALLSLTVAVGGLTLSASAGATPTGGAISRTSAAAKKGVDVWSFRGVDSSLRHSGASWYLTWSTSHAGIASGSSHFVPMIWGSGSVTASALAQAEKSGPDLLTFNEPDSSSQANMTVAQALALWPRLEATKLQLASPAVATDAATPGSWLDQFMKGAARRHYRVDFIAVHWYGGDFRTGPAVSELESYLAAIHARYHLPLWLTEYSLINFAGPTPTYPTEAQQAAFVTASIRMLDKLSYVHRYAWFALPAAASGPSTGLFHPGGTATGVGRAFEKA